MAVIKMLANAIQFIDDSGTVYQTSKSLLASQMANKINGGFVVLTQMPLGVSPDRFPPSPIYGAGKLSNVKVGTTTKDDAYSVKHKKNMAQRKATEDKQIDW